MPRALIIAAAVALSLGIAAPARADTQASATLSDIQIRLVDLDPSDGIAPSMSFADGVGSYASATARSLTYPPKAGQSTLFGAGPFGAVSSAADATSTGARASVAGDVFTGSGTFQATSFSNLAALGQATGNACIGDSGCEPRFILSPETALHVSGIATLSSAAGDDDRAYAVVILAMDYDVPGGQVSNGYAEVGAGRFDTPFALTHDIVPMSIQLINDSTEPLLGSLSIDVYATSDSQLDAPPSTAPEPAGAALAGLGCLTLMAASRLRRRSVRTDARP